MTSSAFDLSGSSSLIERPLGLCAVHTGGLMGLSFQPIVVEVCSRRGPSHFQLAGLAETAVREARIRLGSALMSLSVNLDEYSLVVNLAPANLRKSGSGLDLALAIAILKAVGRVPLDSSENAVFFGEVALDGSLRAIPGVLPLVDGARRAGHTSAFVPQDNAAEAAHVQGITVFPIRDVRQLIAHMIGDHTLSPVEVVPFVPEPSFEPDLADVRGQPAAKRALLVAAAGNHHLLLVGPPGSGKSLLARRLPGLLPELTAEQALETTKVHSVAGILDAQSGIVATPPFRAPHHSVSEAGLVGGGSLPRPGEISLAHHGVLFLDELPEFKRSALESLRQPLEDHVVRVVRARSSATFPSHPLLVAAMNPCPCGNWGNPRAVCRCGSETRLRYLSRISGPLLDRIDLHVVVPPADLKAWRKRNRAEIGEGTQLSRMVVKKARLRQSARQRSGRVSATVNAELTLDELEAVAQPDSAGQRLLDLAIEREQLSARAYVRVLRVARTLADLAESDVVCAEHLGEALRYRVSDLAQC